MVSCGGWFGCVVLCFEWFGGVGCCGCVLMCLVGSFCVFEIVV